MIGVIAADIIGSVYEHHGVKTTDFPLFRPISGFTDDTVLTVATAHAILHDTPYERAYHAFGRRHRYAGYGKAFRAWLATDDPQPYDSYGNGSAMRVAPVGIAFDTADDVLREAERSARYTHVHEEGIRGAQAVALAVFRARTGASKDAIRDEIADRFGYALDRRIDDIRPTYRFDVSAQGSVPEAIVAFLESTSYEDAVRLAISLGGDADTQAAIAGGIAHAFHGEVPPDIDREARKRLSADLREVLDAFEARYPMRR